MFIQVKLFGIWFECRNFFDLDPAFSGEEVAARTAELRLRYARLRDELLTYKRDAGGDRGLARFFKEEAQEALKFYRAACLLLPLVTGDYPGDCKALDLDAYPRELVPYLDHVINVATCDELWTERAR